MSNYTELKNQLNNSKTILITSHKSPDPDAIASSLVAYGILKENLKNKNVYVTNESGSLNGMEFNVGNDDILVGSLKHTIDKIGPDLLILVDAGELSRATDEYAEVKEIIKEKNINYIVIDHHEIVEDGYNMSFNSKASSAVEEVYDVLIHHLDFDKYKGIEETTIMGIISDTGNFRYLTKDKNPKRTFAIVLECINAGVTIESVTSKLNNYTFAHLEMYREILNNFVVTDKYNYSFISDEFFRKSVKGKVRPEVYSWGAKMAMDQFIRNVDDKKFGFIISHDIEKEGVYNGSFRSVNDYIDTSIFARLLNGGGHKPASGFHIDDVKDLKEAIDKVENVIEKNWESAIIR